MGGAIGRLAEVGGREEWFLLVEPPPVEVLVLLDVVLPGFAKCRGERQ